MKVALIQLNAQADKKKNIAKALKYASSAVRNKASFVLLPEVYTYRGALSRKILNDTVAEKIPGEGSRPFMELAKQHKVFILLGSLYELIDGPDTRAFNTSLLISDDGRIISKYRKINMFNAVINGTAIKESENFQSGDRPATARVRDFNVGLSVCYDVRFPAMYQDYSQRGCHILTVPSNFTKKTGEAHWETLLRARAIENLCYVLAPNQVGRDARGIAAFGSSIVVDPWGKVLAKASHNREEIVYANIDLKIVKKVRSLLPMVVK